jgi:hypothetical protein
VNIQTILAVSVAAAATTLVAQPITARADDYAVYEFGSPSKNIGCTLRYQPPAPDVPTPAPPGEQRGFDNRVQCDVLPHTFVGPTSGPGPCTFMLRPTGAPELTCGRGGVLPTIYTVLDYGQTRTAGAITCSSAPEPAGITCTNADSGHFFRVSRASYQIG